MELFLSRGGLGAAPALIMNKTPSPETTALLIKIAEHINSCYVRGDDGRLWPTFRTPPAELRMSSDGMVHPVVLTPGKSTK